MEKKKQMVSASVQPKNGRLYAVIWCRHGPDGKEKPVWRALGLDESTRASIVNKRLREVTNEFEAKINSETEAPPEAAEGEGAGCLSLVKREIPAAASMRIMMIRAKIRCRFISAS